MLVIPFSSANLAAAPGCWLNCKKQMGARTFATSALACSRDLGGVLSLTDATINDVRPGQALVSNFAQILAEQLGILCHALYDSSKAVQQEHRAATGKIQ